MSAPMDVTEATRRQTLRDAVAQHFMTYPAIWINAVDLMAIGGLQAWRTRISDCRVELSMHIENRCERIRGSDGAVTILSSYRYLPHVPIGPDAGMHRERSLFDGDPAGERR